MAVAAPVVAVAVAAVAVTVAVPAVVAPGCVGVGDGCGRTSSSSSFPDSVADLPAHSSTKQPKPKLNLNPDPTNHFFVGMPPYDPMFMCSFGF